MLPSRGLVRNPATALRYSFYNKAKPTRTLSARQFSQAQPQSQSSVLSKRALCRPSPSQHSQAASALLAAGYGTPIGSTSGVFAQRSGAARNLSLWPFQSKPREPQTTEALLPESSTTSAPTATQPPQVEISSSSTPAEPVSNGAVPPLTPQTDPSQLPDDLLREFDSHSILDIPEHIGYLSELGLDYGWGPTSCCQWLLEHIHVYSGLPWWGSLAAIAFIFRGAMFFPTLTGAKHQAKLQKVQSSPAFIQAKSEFNDAAFRTKDQAAMLQARGRMRHLTQQAGISMWRSFIGFAMIPFSFGMFRLVRGMTHIPIPGLETGGLAWFTDLTVSDPLYILPSAAIALTVLTLKQTQNARLSNEPSQAAIMKGMMYVMPPLMFLGTAWLPAALQWFFLLMSVGSVAQTTATLNPAVRRWASLPPLPNNNSGRPVPVIPYQKPTIRDSMLAVSQKLKEATGTTDEKARWKKAQEYEEQRAEEERQRADRRMEEIRRRRAERQ